MWWKILLPLEQKLLKISRFLIKKQEPWLLEHIRNLYNRRLPHTPAIVTEIAIQLAGRAPEDKWFSSFFNRHKEVLDYCYLNKLGLERHQVDPIYSYNTSLSLAISSMNYIFYWKTPTICMRMPFFLRALLKPNESFLRHLKTSWKVLGAGKDRLRESITVVAKICAGGTALLLLINDSTTGSLQDLWVSDINSNENQAWLSSPPNDWNSDDIGFKLMGGFFTNNTQKKKLEGIGGHYLWTVIDFILL